MRGDVVEVDTGICGARCEEEFLWLSWDDVGWWGEGEGFDRGGVGCEEEGVGELDGGEVLREGAGYAVENAVVGAGDDLDGEVGRVVNSSRSCDAWNLAGFLWCCWRGLCLLWRNDWLIAWLRLLSHVLCALALSRVDHLDG